MRYPVPSNNSTLCETCDYIDPQLCVVTVMQHYENLTHLTHIHANTHTHTHHTHTHTHTTHTYTHTQYAPHTPHTHTHTHTYSIPEAVRASIIKKCTRKIIEHILFAIRSVISLIHLTQQNTFHNITLPTYRSTDSLRSTV